MFCSTIVSIFNSGDAMLNRAQDVLMETTATKFSAFTMWTPMQDARKLLLTPNNHIKLDSTHYFKIILDLIDFQLFFAEETPMELEDTTEAAGNASEDNAEIMSDRLSAKCS